MSDGWDWMSPRLEGPVLQNEPTRLLSSASHSTPRAGRLLPQACKPVCLGDDPNGQAAGTQRHGLFDLAPVRGLDPSAFRVGSDHQIIRRLCRGLLAPPPAGPNFILALPAPAVGKTCRSGRTFDLRTGLPAVDRPAIRWWHEGIPRLPSCHRPAHRAASTALCFYCCF